MDVLRDTSITPTGFDEVINGKITPKTVDARSTWITNIIQAYINSCILIDEHDYICAGGGYFLDAENMFVPDIACINKQRLVNDPLTEAACAPEFAIEVKASSYWIRTMRRKAEKYLERGTKMVWLVLPDTQTIEVYDVAHDDVKVYGMTDTLDGGTVLPGFTLAVGSLFS